MFSDRIVHPVLRVRPVTRAIWNIYGVPDYSHHLMRCAVHESFMSMQNKASKRKK